VQGAKARLESGVEEHWAQGAKARSEESHGWFALACSIPVEGNFLHFSRMGEARSDQFGALPWLAGRAAVVVAGLDVPLCLVVQVCLPEALDDLSRRVVPLYPLENLVAQFHLAVPVGLPEASDDLLRPAVLGVQSGEFLDPLPPVALVFLPEASAEVRVRGNRQRVYRWECCD
jgi:hypothetical protein